MDPVLTWVPAVQLLRPQGRRGELLAELYGTADLITSGRTFWLCKGEHDVPPPSGERLVEGAWEPTGRNAGRIVIKLAGVDSISAAEVLAGQFLLLRSADLPALAPDTFRVRDLIGCSLFDGATRCGAVVDVQFPIGADGRTRLEDAPDLLAVTPAVPEEGEDGEPVLIPFVRAWLVGVDLEARRIDMHLPTGLFAASATPETDEPAV